MRDDVMMIKIRMERKIRDEVEDKLIKRKKKRKMMMN